MFSGGRSGAAVLLVALMGVWTAVLAAGPISVGDTSVLLVGLLVTVAVAAHVLVWRADDLLLTLGRTTRGPTDEEHRRHGELRRHSHPDTAGRPRPRAPGVPAEAAAAH